MSTLMSSGFDRSPDQIRFPLPPEHAEAHEWSFVVCGDWMPWDTQWQAMLKDPAGFYGDLLPVLQDADLAILNLEGVLMDQDLPPIVKDGISMKLPVGLIAGLLAVPFHLACLANNHSFDYGRDGLVHTQELLRQHNVQFVGAGLSVEEATSARTFEFGGVRLAVVNVAEGEEACSVDGGPGVAPLDLPYLHTQLSALRKEADVLVTIVHAGREHLPVPAPYIRDAYHFLVDAGADLVIGHHPHVPQGIEVYHGVPIAYSLGNFALFTGTAMRYHYLGYFLKARFRGSKLSALEMWPYWIAADGLGLLRGESLAAFLSEWRKLSALITDDGHLSAVWNAYADHWLATHGIQELAEGIALVGNGALLLQAILKVSLQRFNEDRLVHRMARRALWRAIRWLDRRVSSEHSLPRSRSAQAKRGASILRNRFDIPAHRELYLTALGRVMDGRCSPTPGWARQLLFDWQVF